MYSDEIDVSFVQRDRSQDKHQSEMKMYHLAYVNNRLIISSYMYRSYVHVHFDHPLEIQMYVMLQSMDLITQGRLLSMGFRANASLR